MKTEKILFLFGAGASYGSHEDKAIVPPLGAGLFKALKDFDPYRWGALDDSLNIIFEQDFEQGMRAVFEREQELSKKIPLQQVLGAFFFFKFPIKQDNLYLKLISRIQKSNWRGQVATLNYDTLLQQAITAHGLIYTYGGYNPVPYGNIQLCFPHGSCNFFAGNVFIFARKITMGEGAKIDSGISLVEDKVQYYEKMREACAPCMSYFIENKSTNFGSSFIEQEKERYKELVSNAEKIIIVGAALREYDTHIWEPLKNTKANIIYCSGAKDGQIFKDWCNKYRQAGQNKALMGFFKEEFEEICKEAGI